MRFNSPARSPEAPVSKYGMNNQLKAGCICTPEENTPKDLIPCSWKVVKTGILGHDSTPSKRHSNKTTDSGYLECDEFIDHVASRCLAYIRWIATNAGNEFKHLLDEIAMARLLLFGGKGGVGKTTTSASTAVWLADSGLKVLLVSSDPAHSTSDSLGVALSSEPTPVEGVPGLFGLELNPEAKLSTFMPKLGESLSGMSSSPFASLGGLGGMFDQSAKDEMASIKEEVDSSELVLPGLDEAIAFDELLKHVENPAWDVIVFDTAPTGHTLRFLSLPELIEAWSGRLLRMMRVSGGLRSMLFGRKQSEAMREELERFRRRVLHVRRVLSDPSTTSFTLVTIPERMGVNETVRANASLNGKELPVTGCLVNRVTPELTIPSCREGDPKSKVTLLNWKQRSIFLSQPWSYSILKFKG